MIMKTNIKYGVLSIALLASSLMQCSGPSEDRTAEVAPANENVVHLTSTQMKNAEIAIGEAVTRTVNRTIRLTGVVDVFPSNKVFVSNPFGGFVKTTKALPGLRVKRGELLFTMEDPQYIQLQQDYLMAKSRLQFLETDYHRQEDLNKDKSISDKVYQQTKAEYTSQKIAVRSLEEKLRLININPDALTAENISRNVKIYAPMDGYVSAVFASVGKYSNSTEALLELTDEKALHASLTVFEKDLPYIAVGQRIKIKSPSRPEKEYTATVHTINRSLNTDRSSEIHCDFEDQDGNVLPGMFISADVAIDEAEVIAVPEDAVVSWDNKRFIFTVDGKDQFEMMQVETGMNSDGFIEVKDDIKGKSLVTKNAYSLLMKLKNNEE